MLRGRRAPGPGHRLPRDVPRTRLRTASPILGPDGEPVDRRRCATCRRASGSSPAATRRSAGSSSIALGEPDTFDRDGTPIGGHAEVVLNGEVRMALWKDLGVVGFLDAGNVFSTVSNLVAGTPAGRHRVRRPIQLPGRAVPHRLRVQARDASHVRVRESRRPVRAAHQHRAGVLGRSRQKSEVRSRGRRQKSRSSEARRRGDP
ncbi:MAG: hypothetical protein MZV64_13540 [Ignavibacteriales bacterium]|nr:hypothetical protein [Ignavibacteriales bacterium]